MVAKVMQSDDVGCDYYYHGDDMILFSVFATWKTTEENQEYHPS